MASPMNKPHDITIPRLPRVGTACLALLATVWLPGCGSPSGGDGPESKSIGRLLEGTWACQAAAGQLSQTAEREVTFAPDPGDPSRGTYSAKPGGAGNWSIAASRREGDGSYFVALHMTPSQSPPSGGKPRVKEDRSAGEWLLALTAERSFVRGVEGVMLTYRRQP